MVNIYFTPAVFDNSLPFSSPWHKILSHYPLNTISSLTSNFVFMKIFTSALSVLLLLLLGSCQKSINEQEDANNKKAEEFKTYLTTSAKFHAVDYWAESPIDYDETDGEVHLETDLKKYIRDYILDDDIIFGQNGQVTFVQNEVKIGNNSAAEIRMPYRAYGDKNGVLFDYIDDSYNPLTYYLYEQTATYFVLAWKRPQDGVRLFSKYETVL
jgi:hypothetical protein